MTDIQNQNRRTAARLVLQGFDVVYDSQQSGLFADQMIHINPTHKATTLREDKTTDVQLRYSCANGFPFFAVTTENQSCPPPLPSPTTHPFLPPSFQFVFSQSEIVSNLVLYPQSTTATISGRVISQSGMKVETDDCLSWCRQYYYYGSLLSGGN